MRELRFRGMNEAQWRDAQAKDLPVHSACSPALSSEEVERKRYITLLQFGFEGKACADLSPERRAGWEWVETDDALAEVLSGTSRPDGTRATSLANIRDLLRQALPVGLDFYQVLIDLWNAEASRPDGKRLGCGCVLWKSRGGFAVTSACIDHAAKGAHDVAIMERNTLLADQCGDLAHTNKALLAENAELRRFKEKVERRR